MKYQVIEADGAWAVVFNGVEQARFETQEAALLHVADRLRASAIPNHPASFGIRYRARA